MLSAWYRCADVRALAAAFLLLAALPASSAPGFVSNIRVSEAEAGASIEVNFNCQVTNVQSEPPEGGDRLRIFFDATSICNGVPPSVSETRGRFRPARSDLAKLVDIEYDREVTGESSLTMSFSEPVTFHVDSPAVGFRLTVDVAPRATVPAASQAPGPVLHRQVSQPVVETPAFVINLMSFRRVPTLADVPELDVPGSLRVFYTPIDLDGQTWYRLRIGDFETSQEARAMLAGFEAKFPGAWIDQPADKESSVELVAASQPDSVETPPVDRTLSDPPSSEIDALMAEARQTMLDGDRSRAIQIYTKILQLPPHPRQAEAQELLALARERNGQSAHAKAEYQRFLSLYPDHEAATRVRQRLAALIASERKAPEASAADTGPRKRRVASDWRFQSFFSQYYRRDVNQQNEQDEIVSQSALYSDVNFDARRRGERFDFSARLSAGYRNDFLDEQFGSGNETRISYAYADLADAKTRLRGRIGRQSRNTGGILGRFDGINLGYQLTERVLLNGVVGKPAYSSNDGIDSSRNFYGLSATYGPFFDGLELGTFFVHQTIESVADRQAIGAEFRYFGDKQSIWGLIDYDTLFNELGSAFLQASWRFGTRLTLSGSVDQRHSPFLSTGNALIGQPVADFAALVDIFTEDELQQLGLDRSPKSTTYSVGASWSLTPRLQVNADVNDTSVDATPDSGGVFGMPASSYRYISTNVVASSLFREGDVTILGLRQSQSDTSDVLSLTLDSRFPFGRAWRVNPRLRVDRRDRQGDLDYEWIYTPGLRIQYRRGQRMRVELEAGKQYSQRETPTIDFDRESYFINLGYQMFF